MDGRIDDPSAGWKGRGVWTTSGDRTLWMKEGGKCTVPIAFRGTGKQQVTWEVATQFGGRRSRQAGLRA
jgi:hypothetical protein